MLEDGLSDWIVSAAMELDVAADELLDLIPDSLLDLVALEASAPRTESGFPAPD